MRDIDPHWHIGDTYKGSSNPSGRSAIPARRRPAAIAGIALVFAAGFLLTRGTSDIIGQMQQEAATAPLSEDKAEPVAPKEVIIRIGADGVDPANAEAHPGDTITWINEQEMPHILTSETLLDAEGPLDSPALFQGMSYSFTLAREQPSGAHAYMSETDDEIAGEITVDASAAPLPPPPAAMAQPALPEPVAPPPTAEETVANTSTASSSSAAPADQQHLIPRNPYAIGSTKEHPFDPQGQPIDALFDREAAPLKQAALAERRMPVTGTNAWAIAVGSAACLLWANRRQMGKQRLGAIR